VSLVCHGVFEKYPGLRVAVLETGTLWLPEVFWRLDANWKALRAEVPWVKRLPSELIREHMIFGSQPLEEPRKLRQLHQVLEAIDGLEDMLVLCTDYPHWDFDAPDLVLARLPASWREKVGSENARRFYGLPVRDTDAVAP
jgi:predicted TIM-barrel fold metal-dependent hydrolase